MAAVALAAPVAAPAALETVAGDAGARMERLSANAYVILHEDATDAWPHGNTGVIVGKTGVFVIDSCYLPSRAKADIELIRKLTPLPVRFLLTTHWHFDHNNGAAAYRDAYPGVTLVAERNTARWIELNQEFWKAPALPSLAHLVPRLGLTTVIRTSFRVPRSRPPTITVRNCFLLPRITQQTLPFFR